MRRSIVFTLIFCFLGACLLGSIFVLGCGGGGGGSGIGTILGAAIFIIAITASAGTASPVLFSASVREKPQAAIFSAVSLKDNKIKIKIQPMKNGINEGNPVFVDTASITVENSAISANVGVESTTNQYSVEVFSSENESNPLLKCIVSADQAPKDGEILPAEINAISTAYSMVYSQWVVQNPTDKSYSAFVYNVSAEYVYQYDIRRETRKG